MSTRSVSPQTVILVAIASAGLLWLSLMPLETVLNRHLDVLLRHLDIPPGPPKPGLLLIPMIPLSVFLVFAALWILGIRMRGQSVERLRAAGHGKGGDGAVDLPIRIRDGD